jgi:spore coat protein U-like protein
MKLTKLFLLLASASALLVSSAGSAFADASKNNLLVKVTVKTTCTIDAENVIFPAYDPTGLAVTNTSGSVTITCSKGSAPPIGISVGANAGGGTQRKMKGGASGADLINYDLYKTTVGGAVWGDAVVSDRLTPAVSSSALTPQIIPIVGNIPAGQDVSVGDYLDTVTATVYF